MAQTLNYGPGVTDRMKREYEAYLARPDDWKAARLGRFLVLNDGEVAAEFDDMIEAYRHGVVNFGPGEFLVHKVGSEDETIILLPVGLE